MAEQTHLLELPYILPSQAQKHVTHNEALRMLDALLHIAVQDADRNEPPETPAEGQRHLVGPEPTGPFSGRAGQIAAYQDGAWSCFEPRAGWILWDASSEALLVHDGTAWVAAASFPATLPLLGINATADETNRLSVAADATLLTHEGSGHQLKINKAAAGDTGALLFQTAWSGRAEIGLAGGDDLSIKVSPDGASWQTALSVARSDGEVTAGSLTVASGTTGASGLRFGDLDAASTPGASNNRLLTVDADGDVVLSTAAVPAYVMNGVDSSVSITRDYDAQVAKGTGVYVGDNGGVIASGPGAEWYSTSFTGVNAAVGYFGQLVLSDTSAYFRGGSTLAPGSAAWYRLAAVGLGLGHGQIPFNSVVGSTHTLVGSSLTQGSGGNIGINASSPDASAALDLGGTTRGFLPPRLSTGQRDAIVAPAAGLTIFNTSMGVQQVWNGSAWTGGTFPLAPSVTVGTLPSPSAVGAGAMAFVSDETGGSTLAFSDGADWRRVSDRAVVS